VMMMDFIQWYEQSNHPEATFPIIWNITRTVVFQYCKLNPIGAKWCQDNNIPVTKASIMWMMINPWPVIKTLEDLAKCCTMSKWEVQNHITWCFKRFADFTDYIDYAEYVSNLNIAIFIQCIAMAVWVTSFHCDRQGLLMLVARSPQSAGSISHQYMIQCSSDWRRVHIATSRSELDAFLYISLCFEFLRMLYILVNGYLPWFRYLQPGWHVRQLVG
jgi:hypothetical protein